MKARFVCHLSCELLIGWSCFVEPIRVHFTNKVKLIKNKVNNIYLIPACELAPENITKYDIFHLI